MTGRILRLSLTVNGSMQFSMACRLVLFLVPLLLAGCSSLNHHFHDCGWQEVVRNCRNGHSAANMTSAREAAFWASQHERAGSDECVELYFLTAKLSCSEGLPASHAIYRDSLAGLIRTAQQFERYDPVDGIQVEGNGSFPTVPISYRGFAWSPRDFDRLVIADRFVRTDLEVQYYNPGVGVPLIVLRETDRPDRFHTQRSHFAATANLRRSAETSGNDDPGWVLELADPLVVDCTQWRGQTVRLAADYSAPSRYIVDREQRTYLLNFLRPDGNTAEPKLILLGPYQPGKIPLIFVHGLLSDSMTWAELYETVKVDPELRDRYQFWAFQYPTGGAFLRSAANLRRELDAVIACIDPNGNDEALSQMVLVGHSMGGLLAKLQITSSRDELWRSYANQPIESLQASAQMRNHLQELFFFEPSPHIRRVVYIGTPHNGSGWATRTVGRLGSYLVRIPGVEEREYRAFLAANPGVVHKFAGKRIPTSVDMLEPDNPILTSMARLPKPARVATHSIIGTGGFSLCAEPSDGVVPLSSARIPGVESELFVAADHEDLHRDPETAREVVRILRLHLQCVDGHVP